MRISKQRHDDKVATYSGDLIAKSTMFMGRVFKMVSSTTDDLNLIGNVYLIANTARGLVGINLATGRWIELEPGDRYQEHYAEVLIGEAK